MRFPSKVQAQAASFTGGTQRWEALLKKGLAGSPASPVMDKFIVLDEDDPYGLATPN